MSSLEIVPGGKLLALYEGRPIRELGKISAVNAHIAESLRLGTRGFVEAGNGVTEVFQFRDSQRAKYPFRSIHYNMALINRNPNNYERCESLEDEIGMTVLLSTAYPDAHPRLGHQSMYSHNLGHLGDYEHLMKPHGAHGAKIIRFPFGKYRFIDRFEYKYPPVLLAPNMSIYPGRMRDLYISNPFDARHDSTDDEMGYDAKACDITADSTADFLDRDYAYNFRRHKIPLDQSWVARIEGDNGSVWQNPFFSTNGLKINHKEWPQ